MLSFVFILFWHYRQFSRICLLGFGSDGALTGLFILVVRGRITSGFSKDPVASGQRNEYFISKFTHRLILISFKESYCSESAKSSVQYSIYFQFR